MSPLDPEIPPAGEDIHLPGPSVQPVLLAASITLGLVGITTFFPFVIAGVLMSLIIIVRWVRGARRDIDELPLDHH
jgi:TRAP-type C4-dicarboxylate transport system permease small subunit